MRLSVRARFALATALAVVAVAAGVAVAGYASLRGSLDGQARRSAAGQARQLAAVVEPAPGEGNGMGNFVEIGDPSLTSQFVRSGLWAATVDAHGRPLHRSAGAPKLASAGLITACARDGTAEARLSKPAAEVACSRVGRGAVRGFVLAAVPLAANNRTLASTRRALIVAVLAGTAGSFVFAWLVAASSLRPLRRIVRTARSIREGKLDQRIGYAHRDELGDVAVELDSSFAELEAVLRRQEQFVTDASHELKTPLAAARANVQLLRRWAAEEPATRDEALAALERSIARMSRVVSDLLHLARGDRSAYASELVPVDGVLLDAVRDARSLRVDVQLDVEQLDEAVVIGDRHRLLQLIGNLLDNAIRVTPPDATIRLALARANGRVRLTVADEGPGIDESELPHVFERFYRGASGGGAGLGLAIAHTVAHAHGGQLSVTSTSERGTTFIVDLPLADTTS